MKGEDKYWYLKKILSSEQLYINRYLRNGERNDKSTEKVIYEINLALDAIPAYNNRIVHHCGSIGQASVKELAIWFKKRIGENVQFPSFLSTTKNSDHYFKNQDKVFEIQTSEDSNGKDVAALDFEKPEEGEVTFKSGAFFKIVAAESNLITIEELTEIPEEYEILGEDYFLEDEEIKACFVPEENGVLRMPNSSDLNRI